MRTSFIAGIFALALGVAGIAEWASRQPADVKPPEASAGAAKEARSSPADAAGAIQPPDRLDQKVSRAPSDDVKRVVVLGDDGRAFRLNGVTLSDEMIATIDALFAGSDAADLICGRFVVEGHTDSLGSKEVNDKIGLARALAVRQYLHERYDIPRDAVRVVSYGSDQPAADNSTQEGRSLNRRVVIKVLNEVHTH
jgi:outer membrane protein OmpA-like peptidoglycan-associated protein